VSGERYGAGAVAELPGPGASRAGSAVIVAE
jgi:hypothetical protein